MKKYNKIAIIGGGVMGTVLARALVKMRAGKQVLICEKNRRHHRQLKKLGAQVSVTRQIELCSDADIIFLAVKPQDFNGVKLKINKQTLICSIMAGVSISDIRAKLKIEKIIRMMPNMAARVGKSFTAWTAAARVSVQEKKWIENFLARIGLQLYVKTEQEIDKATAVTGSGPAYIFNTLFVFMQSAQKLGFTREETHRMAIQVLRGVNALVNKDTDFTELTHQVTSKGGTTEAALKVFANSDFKKTWVKAITAAYKRARELSKQK